MKKPIKPSKPTRPAEPNAFMEQKIEIGYNFLNGSLSDLEKALPEGVRLNELKFEYFSTDCYSCFNEGYKIYYIRTVDNPQYEKAFQAWNKSMEKYRTNVEEYASKMEVYNAEMKKYVANLKSKETKELEKKIMKLKKDSAKKIADLEGEIT